jgi:L-amino acid N-acyltransferase YncA
VVDEPNQGVIRTATAEDAAALAQIYNHYVEHTVVTFEEQPVAVAEMAGRLVETAAAGLPWLVVAQAEGARGYAHASKWKGRCAYRYSVEVTVYLAPGATGRGLGRALYEALFRQLRAQGYHCAMGGIALPNAASVALHERMGMAKVAHFREVGYKFGRWIDVGYWQGMLGN